MAGVNYTGAPEGLAPDQAPDATQRIQANPAAFGAGAAQGAEHLGAGMEKAGDFFGEVQLDDAVNGAMSQVNKTLDGYRALNGADALRAREETEEQIKTHFSEAREGLSSNVQKDAFDRTTRSYRLRYVDSLVANHADQAAKTYATNTTKASFELALNGVANVADNDEAVKHWQADARYAMRQQVIAQGNGSNPELMADADLRADRAVYKTQIQTVAVQDPVRALKIADDHKDTLGVEYAQLSAQLRTRVTDQQGLEVADRAFGQTAQQLPNAQPLQKDTAAVQQAIWMQESGDKGPNPGQVQPETAARFAKPGEDVNDPAVLRTISKRYTDYLAALPTVQGDPARIAVGYFSGEGNIAPIGAPQPYRVDRTDRLGKSVSSYVSDITQRVSQQGPMLAARAGVYDNIMAATEGNPHVRQVALREVDQRYRAAEISSLADGKARQDQQNSAIRGYGDLIRDGKGTTAPWRKDPNLTEEHVEHLDKLQIESLREPKGLYGMGYSDVQSRIYSTGADRIVNDEQLLGLVGRGLTPDGYAEASKHLAEVKKPGAEADRVLQGNFYASAKKAVTLEFEGLENSISPERREAWDEALPVVNRALEQGRAKGLTNDQLMDPTNKDSVWTALKPFLPTPAEQQKAQIDHDAVAAKKVTDYRNIKTLEDAQKAYNNHQITPEQARELYTKNGWGKKDATPQVPQGQTTSAPDVRDLLASKDDPSMDRTKWDKRADGSEKGAGFLGLLKRPDGGVSSEISVGIDMDGKETEIPLMVPTLSRPEVDTLLKLDEKGDDFWQRVPQSVKQKAVEFARKRIAAGKSPFADPAESPK